MFKLLQMLISLTLIFTGFGHESGYEETESTWAMDRAWASMTEEQRMNAPIEYQANAVRLTVDEFILMARVVEAESDRSNDVYSKSHIAACIFDRVYSKSFPGTVRGVLTQSGQFSTVSGGNCSISATKTSRWAIIIGYRAVYSGEIPRNLLYFNCIGYNGFTPYGYIGGNYFMTA